MDNYMELRREAVAKVRRLVVKIGSGVLTHHSEIIDQDVVDSLVDDMSAIMDTGMELVIVTSGAIAAGSRKLGFKDKPKRMREKQAAAAAGQSALIGCYERAFEKRGKKVAQILLTGDGLSDRGRYLNARNTISTLLHYGVVPIINENDTVAVEEIRFGDNDNLSARVAGLADADLLIILTDTEGLYDKDPRKFEDAAIIPYVKASDFDEQTAGASVSVSGVGTGGMVTKVEAAKIAATFAVPTVIANGERKGVLVEIVQGDDRGTFFAPGEERIRGRKKWIAYNRSVSGKVIVDKGARRAVEGGNSLLPSGVVGLDGKFLFGDLVSIVDDRGEEFARGLVQYGSDDIEAIKGLKTVDVENVLGKKDYDEVVHRDDMIII